MITTEQRHIHSVMEFLRISESDFTIAPDGTVDVYDNFILKSHDKDECGLVKDGRLTIKFGTIHGSFCIKKLGLTTLEGCPHTVDWNFWCSENELTSLRGGPINVGLWYHCSYNFLKNLIGAPNKVESFNVSNNFLENLIGAPETVCSFDVSNNKLTSLEGIPKSITHLFDVTGNDSLYDPRGLRDSNFISPRAEFNFPNWTPPFAALCSKFCDTKMFQESLDYNYLKFDEGEWKIIRFKWIEAHEEFGLEAPEEVLGYKMI